MPNALHDSPFLKACRREKTPYTPVWLMRQAGRYMKDYRALREKKPFLELCKDPELACEITVHAQRTIKADAAILFSDILLILEPMGAALKYLPTGGPSIGDAVRTGEDVDRLKPAEPEKNLVFVAQAIRRIKKGLDPSIPLIGFAGAPFTLASYLIEGGSSKDFSKTRQFMHEDEARWKVLMDKLVDSSVLYLKMQIDAGADALQVFDSWAGVLSPEEYREHVLPFSKRLLDALKGSACLSGRQAPVIHFGTRTGPFLEDFARAGGDVIGVDHRIGLDKAWERIGKDRAIQGNLDPEVLLKDWKSVEKEAKRVLSEAAGRPGHIFNLGHGVLPQTPLENVISLVDMVKSFTL